MTAGTTPSAIKLAKRRGQALQLRINGRSFRQIAEELGLGNPGTAWKDVQAALEDAVTEPAREALAVELMRLDELVAAIWPAVLSGDISSCRVALSAMERRTRYLGLDAPNRTVVDLTAQSVPLLDLSDPREIHEAAMAALDELLPPTAEAYSFAQDAAIATFAATMTTQRRKETT